MRSLFRDTGVLFVALLAGALAACQRTGQGASAIASPGKLERPVAMQGELQPGTPVRRAPLENPFDGNPKEIAEGRRLYHWYNCGGCHFNGGGGMGPPLMDDEWIYGGEPENIYDSIYRGRPNGMPAFGGRIPEVQMWKIAAFVAGLNPEPIAPAGRSGRGQGSAVRPEGGANR